MEQKGRRRMVNIAVWLVVAALFVVGFYSMGSADGGVRRWTSVDTPLSDDCIRSALALSGYEVVKKASDCARLKTPRRLDVFNSDRLEVCQRDSRVEVTFGWIGHVPDDKEKQRALLVAAQEETANILETVLRECAAGDRHPVECSAHVPTEEPHACDGAAEAR